MIAGPTSGNSLTDLLTIQTCNINGIMAHSTLLLNHLEKSKPSILALQETKATNIRSISDEIRPLNYTVLHKSASDPTSKVNQVKHGQAIIVSNELKYEPFCTDIDDHDHELQARFHGIRLTEYDLIIISVYFPSTSSLSDAGSLTIADRHLQKCEEAIHYLNLLLEGQTNVLLLGDFNVDYYRDIGKPKLGLFQANFANFTDHDLLKFGTSPAKLPITFKNHMTSGRYLDRVISTLPEQSCTDYSIPHNIDLGSDHWLVSTKFQLLPVNRTNKNVPTCDNHLPNIAYHRIQPKHIDRVNRELNRSILLKFRSLPFDDCSFHLFLNEISSVIRRYCPKSKKRRGNSVVDADFLEKVKPCIEELNHWRSQSNPAYDPFYRAMETRAKSKLSKALKSYQVRYNQNKAAALTQRTCFTHIKKQNIQLANPPILLEDKGPSSQLDLLYDHYKDQMNGHSKAAPVTGLLPKFEGKRPSFTRLELELAIDMIDTKKSFDHHFFWRKMAGPRVKSHLLKFLNSWVARVCEGESATWSFLWTTIVPILKGSDKSPSKLKSWRPISLMTSEAWLLEKMLKFRMDPYLQTSNHQFAYKNRHGCNHAINIAQKCNSEPDVHVALLDATAAFTKISHQRIAAEMQRRKIPIEYRYLCFGLCLYSQFKIKWFGQLSFDGLFAWKGIKQGGVMSALLFVIALDPLVDELLMTGAGVSLAGVRVPCLIFADDIALFSCSSEGLKLLFDTVMGFCSRFDDLQMNPGKSVILRMGYKCLEPRSFYDIETKKFSRYLGAWLTDFKHRHVESARCAGSIYGKINNVVRNQPHLKYATPANKRQIVSCLSVPYCIELFEFNDKKSLQKISKAHRQMTTLLWPKSRHLKDETGNRIKYISNQKLYDFTGTRSIYEIHTKIRTSFLERAVLHDNPLIYNIILDKIYVPETKIPNNGKWSILL